MIVEPFSPYFHPEPLSVETAREEGHRVSVSCPDHRVPRSPDLAPEGPLRAFQRLTWPELFPHLRCSACGAPASKLTVMGKNTTDGDWKMLLRICAEEHTFPAPGQKTLRRARRTSRAVSLGSAARSCSLLAQCGPRRATNSLRQLAHAPKRRLANELADGRANAPRSRLERGCPMKAKSPQPEAGGGVRGKDWYSGANGVRPRWFPSSGRAPIIIGRGANLRAVMPCVVPRLFRSCVPRKCRRGSAAARFHSPGGRRASGSASAPKVARSN